MCLKLSSSRADFVRSLRQVGENSPDRLDGAIWFSVAGARFANDSQIRLKRFAFRRWQTASMATRLDHRGKMDLAISSRIFRSCFAE